MNQRLTRVSCSFIVHFSSPHYPFWLSNPESRNHTPICGKISNASWVWVWVWVVVWGVCLDWPDPWSGSAVYTDVESPSDPSFMVNTLPAAVLTFFCLRRAVHRGKRNNANAGHTTPVPLSPAIAPTSETRKQTLNPPRPQDHGYTGR